MFNPGYNAFRNKMRNNASLNLCPIAPAWYLFNCVTLIYIASHYRDGESGSTLSLAASILCCVHLAGMSRPHAEIQFIISLPAVLLIKYFNLQWILERMSSIYSSTKGKMLWRQAITSYSIYKGFWHLNQKEFPPLSSRTCKAFIKAFGPHLPLMYIGTTSWRSVEVKPIQTSSESGNEKWFPLYHGQQFRHKTSR